MPLPLISFIVNAVLLVVALILAMIILRAAAKHAFNYGLTEIQDHMKWIVLRCILALIVIALAATLFNVVISLL